jgi:hypothetical protein
VSSGSSWTYSMMSVNFVLSMIKTLRAFYPQGFYPLLTSWLSLLLQLPVFSRPL